jgi:type IV pilus assembly protein PilC
MPEKLRQRREKLAQVAAKPEGGGAEGTAKAPARRRRKAKVSKEAKTQFTVQLATLQDAGMPILRSLRILEGQVAAGPLKDVVGAMAEDVETGTSLSEAMAKFPGVFDDLYVNMVRAGEAGGALTAIFNRLAEYLEKADALIRKIRSAMIYPIIVVLFASAVMIYIMVSVVPKFEAAFQSLGGKLPAITQSLISISRFLADKWWVIIAAGFVVIAAIVFIGRTKKGRRTFDLLKLKMWLFGPIIADTQVARFSRTLGTLSASGVERLRSLDIAADAAGNVIYSEGIRKVQDAVREGEPMARPMGETKLFDDIVVNMVDVGEETGELDKMLMKIAKNKEVVVDTKVAGLMSVLEPVLLIVMGAVVGFIVIALFMPLLSLQQLISGGK